MVVAIIDVRVACANARSSQLGPGSVLAKTAIPITCALRLKGENSVTQMGHIPWLKGLCYRKNNIQQVVSCVIASLEPAKDGDVKVSYFLPERVAV